MDKSHGKSRTENGNKQMENRRPRAQEIERREKQLPGPHSYKVESNWKRSDGAFKKCARNTHLDVIAKKEKEKPSAASYRPKAVGYDTIKGGK